jgi:preprotein translocase subunit SecF
MQILKSFLAHSKIDFMRMHKLAIVASVVCIILSIALVAVKGLNFGIDFSGGILIEIRADKIDAEKLRSTLSSKIKDVQIQNIGADDFLIRVAKSAEESSSEQEVVKNIQAIISHNFSGVEYRKVDYVGPQVGTELIGKGVMALLMSFIFIMIYIWVRFDWQFGLGGIFALLHDTFLTLGFYSITGLEFNLTSIAAILTVIGYSINDSVVIYDRIRENLRKFKKHDLADLINSSINSTLSRTLLTSGATLLSLLALVLFGGDVLKSFSQAAFFGILVGTYSSIYISAPILLYLDPRKNQKK